MRSPLNQHALEQLFTEARSHHAWLDKPVTDEQLREIYNLTKWGPTSVNALPMRVLFVKSEAEKEKLYPALKGSNAAQVKSAPVTAIIAHDNRFYDYLPNLFPAFDAKSMFETNKSLAESTAFRNSSLQGAYLMLAARSLGLDVCPMSGFDNQVLDAAFLKDTSWSSNFICTIGYGDESKVHPRGPRLEFSEACKII